MKILILLLLSFNVSADSIQWSWVAPTERVDNTPLNGDLAGFNIYYGSSPGIRPTNIPIPDPLATSYTLPDAPYGTYYSVIAAIDKYGLISDFSAEVSVDNLPAPPKPMAVLSVGVLP